MTLDEIFEEIKQAESIVILTHESPDGDAIGSSLAMKLALESIGKKPDVVMTEFSEVFNFLPGAKDIKKPFGEKQYDLAISVDCANFKRMMGNEYFENAKRTIVIDHHGSNAMYGDFNYVNPVSPACCEILIGMFEYYNIDISKEIGSCLIAGIITDTGGFLHASTTADTFEFSAELLRKGINISEIYTRVLKTVTKAHFELEKRVMDRLEFLEDGKIAFSYIDKNDEAKVCAKMGDDEGLVEIGRQIEGVQVSVLIKQKEAGTGIYKISMRSTDAVNVSDVCMMFGGGGHPRAAGGLVEGNGVEDIKNKILKEIKKFM